MAPMQLPSDRTEVPNGGIRFTSPANGIGGVQAAAFDTRAAATPLVPAGDSIPMGGLAGRIAALTGFDPDNPHAPPPGGLFALLLAAQQR